MSPLLGGWANLYTSSGSLTGMDSCLHMWVSEVAQRKPEAVGVQRFSVLHWQMSALPSCLSLLRWRAASTRSRGSWSQKRQRANICTALYSRLYSFPQSLCKAPSFLAKSQKALGPICLMEIPMPGQGT